MTGHLRISKRTRVGEVHGRLDIEPVVVGVDEDLISAARRPMARPGTRLLAVVDAEGRLVGVLPVLRLVEEIVARVSPEELMAEVTDLESAGRFGREVGAHVCRDLMGPPVHLTRDSTVADAFRAMHEHQYSGLPVVDDQMQVVGYVDLLELALRYLDQLPASSAPEALPS